MDRGSICLRAMILAFGLLPFIHMVGEISGTVSEAASPLSVSLNESFAWYGDMWPSTATDAGDIILAFGDGTGEGACIEAIDESGPSSRYNYSEGKVEINPAFERGSCPADMYQLTSTASGTDDWCEAVGCKKNQCYPLCQHTNVGLVFVNPDNVDICESWDGYSNTCLLRRDPPFTLDVTKTPPFSTDIWKFFADDSSTHMARTSTKPSSLLYLKDTGRLYGAFHHPAGTVERGYNAVSDTGHAWTMPFDATKKVFDDAKTWTVAAGSNFTVLMFIQMGNGYEDYTRPDFSGVTVQQRLGDKDKYVYAFGIRHEYDAFTKAGSDAVRRLGGEEIYVDPSYESPSPQKRPGRISCDGKFLDPQQQDVHLARVKIDPSSTLATDPIIDRSKWEYLAGLDEKGNPVWSSTESSYAVRRVDGKKLKTVTQASAIYHFDAGKFIFLTGNFDEVRDSSCNATAHLGLFVADTPWGPWTRVDNGEESSRSIAHILPHYDLKPAPKVQVKVATAGGEFASHPALYHLHIFDVEFTLP